MHAEPRAPRSGARVLLETLRQEGVELVFGNPGTTELPLLDGLASEDGVRYILCLQEAAALAMADGYAQAGGRLAVVNVHASPGLGNAMGMLYNAWKAGTPLLLTAGQHDRSLAATEPMLWSELTSMARPCVKWAAEAGRIEDLPRLVHRAAKAAQSHPRGPVFLSLPTDVLSADSRQEPGKPTRVAPRMRGAGEAVEQAAALLSQAKRPLIVAGDAVAQEDALAELVEVAELLGAPVCLEGWANRCAFPFTHPLFAGLLTNMAPQVRSRLEQHDLLCSIGGDLFSLIVPSEVEPMPPGLKVIHLDTDPWELGKNYPADVAIAGDPKATLPELAAALRRRFGGERHPDAARRIEDSMERRAAVVAKLHKRALADAGRRPIAPLSLMQAVAANLPPDAVVVNESLSSSHGLHDLLQCRDARGFFGLRGGGVGWGLPAALGAKLALPSRPVVALIGDGSALYNIQALWTAAREGIAAVFVIINNKSYRILKRRAHALRSPAAGDGVYVGMDLDRPPVDFVGLARAFGVPGERVESSGAIGPALSRGLGTGGPYLLDVVTDGSF